MKYIRKALYVFTVLALVLAGSRPFTGVLASQEAGDFLVDGDGEFTYAAGVLTITSGDLTVSMAEGKTDTTDRIVIAGNSTVTLSSVTITAEGGPAVGVDEGVTAVLNISGENTVTGAENYAGVEVGYSYDGTTAVLADLTIRGDGTLNASGGNNSAGIGGSYVAAGNKGNVLYGNITLESGTVNASGNNGGAGIGSAANAGTSSSSFKVDGKDWGTITIKGGTVTANGGTGAGAGIGGGNHVDSGRIIINGGEIDATGYGGGAGIGSGRGSSNKGGAADKGHGYYFADVTINGGTISAQGGWLSAGIGGGYECDAIITINGGIIKKAIGGDGNSGSYYQGAPGIGGGYQGNVQFTMTGGTIELAQGGTSAPGIGYGAGLQEYGDKRSAEFETVSCEDSFIEISGGTIKLAQGGMYAAGIGSGNGGIITNINITGGDITAKGYASSSDEMLGGAGIGSGVGTGSGLKYAHETKETISITGGNVLSIGGWGASGVGSGAVNEMADSITLDADTASVEAYSDGTKFAVDTRSVDDEGSTTTAKNTHVTGDILQGTFVHAGKIGDYDQNPEGLNPIVITNDAAGETVTLTQMPAGYRSFAVDVSAAGTYTVYTDDENIGHGEGRYFNKTLKDVYNEDEVTERSVLYTVKDGTLSDNYYLYPVKTVVVEKKVSIEEGDSLEKEKINTTVYFSLWIDAEQQYMKKKDESGQEVQWIESIEIKDGVPQSKAYFVDVEDKTFGVWEVNEDGTDMQIGKDYGIYTLKKIETEHGGDSDNDAVISAKNWTDEVAVVNTYGSTKVSVELSAFKELQNRTLKEGEFSFELRNAAGEVLQTKTNAADGTITFDAIEYDYKDAENSPFVYTVTEVTGSDPSVIYAENTETVQVSVSVDETGHLTASADRTGTDVKFVNTYVDLRFNKYDDAGKEIDGAVITLTCGGEELVSWTSKAGEEFDISGYIGNGRTYTLTETKVPAGYAAMKPVTFTVTDGEITGIDLQKDGSGAYRLVDAKVTVPDTGDRTNVLFWGMAGIGSLLIAILAVLGLKSQASE